MLNFFNLKVVFIFSLWCFLGLSSAKSNQTHSMYTNLMKLNAKFDYLSDKIDQLEANSSSGNKVPVINLDEIKSNFKQVKSSMEEFDSKLIKIQDQGDKTDKTNQLLSELITHQKMKDSAMTHEPSSALNDECTSVCRSKVNKWTNGARIYIKESMETCLTNSAIPSERNPKGVCHPNPCLHGGRCVVTSTGAYQCTECPYPTSGKHCEQFHCGDKRCFHRNEIYYELFDVNVGWDHAHRLCLRGGMTLAYSKDKETTEFLYTKLKSIYGGGHLWMGLKFNEAENEWQWLDGTPLGDYTGNKANFKTTVGQHCGVLYLSSGDFMWEPFSCTRHSYLLCEKRYLTG